MAETPMAGTKYILKVGASGSEKEIGLFRTNNIDFSREAIDITHKGSSEWRTLLPKRGIRQATIGGEGIAAPDDATGAGGTTGNTDVLNKHFESGELIDLTLEDETGNTHTGKFMVTAFSMAGDYNTAVTFSATFESSGEVAYNPNE